jgi:hypothetical protein
VYVTTQSRSSKNGSQTQFTDREAIRFRVFRVFRVFRLFRLFRVFRVFRG